MITATRPDEGNELHELQDALILATEEWLAWCERYGAEPTPSNQRALQRAGKRAEKLAAEYDKLTGKYSDELLY